MPFPLNHLRPLVSAIAIDDDDDKANQRQYKRDIDGRHVEDGVLVDDVGLQRGKYGTSQNGHDETCCTELRIVTQSL